MTNRDESVWLQRGVALVSRIRGDQWALVDWLVEGKREYDQDLKKAVQITGYSVPHICNLIKVGELFPEGKRNKKLPISTHKTLTRFEDEPTRQMFLEQAERKKWTSEEVEKQARKHAKKEEPSKTSYYQPVQVKCPNCDHVFPIKGNKTHDP